ncbi:HD domain-containing protein [Xanthomonas sp. CFBP 8703]|uniref:HD domain-containing protein n=1 Tax=Xanthomonas bonasiae TaxID=2810351 RepID=A0ABS3B7P6_9XANT|nr:HD domain-containing protein [Xanthomonas bonasiae]MBN6102939.1 HD domain-containing protein [Xanthomonas bonasiae]
MRVFDPLYGAFDVPKYIEALALAPEVRRLGSVRLLNTTAPTTATLGDLRRFSHTMGVLHICATARLAGFDEEERRALLACVLVHDVGTPPFGHLFETLLAEEIGWNHERVASDVLLGQSVSSNAAHAVFANRGVGFLKILARNGIDQGLVLDILSKRHPLSVLLFGTLDFDNLDNVARMAWALGFTFDKGFSSRLASQLDVTRTGCLVLSREWSVDVLEWLAVRRRVYEVLFFDAMTVASQALLSRAVGQVMSSSEVSEDDWSLTDEQLLAKMAASKFVDKRLLDSFFGQLPVLAYCIHVQSGTVLDVLSRREIYGHVCKSLSSDIKSDILPFFQKDKRTFGRRMVFNTHDSLSSWSIGEDSSGIVVYAFLLSGSLQKGARINAVRRFLNELEIDESQVLRVSIEREILDESQSSFSF